MDCERTLEMILEADPALLESNLSGAGDHAGHLAACPDCTAAARTAMELQATLREELAAAASSTPFDVAFQEAEAEAGRRRNAGRRPRWRGLVPLGAAAAVAGLLAIRSVWFVPGEDTEGMSYRPEVMASAAAGVEVTAPEGTSVAVFRTPNPDIVVYWFYEGGEGR